MSQILLLPETARALSATKKVIRTNCNIPFERGKKIEVSERLRDLWLDRIFLSDYCNQYNIVQITFLSDIDYGNKMRKQIERREAGIRVRKTEIDGLELT